LSQNEQYRRALDVLRDGGVVALPTDTVFGLCARASDDGAVRHLLAIKQRPAGQALPLFVASIEQAGLIAELTSSARVLAARFWPGALTLIVVRKPSFRTLAAEGPTVGVRAPADPVLRELAAQLGPLTGTSANRHGQPETHTAAEARAQLGDHVDLIVDAPVSATGVASTVVDCTEDRTVRILREGAVSRDELERALRGVATLA
jgi:L-threonylcarbamoyladenylate synthase